MAYDRNKLLIVDGYNVLRSGSRYKHLDGDDFDNDAYNRKREALLNDVLAYAGHEYEAIVVFDGGGNKFSTGQQETFGGAKIIFSPAGSSADRVIERLARTAREHLRETLVVSSDSTIQDTVFGVCVSRLSAEGFCRDCAAMHEENHVTITPRPVKKTTLGRRLDADTVDKLRALRDELQGR